MGTQVFVIINRANMILGTAKVSPHRMRQMSGRSIGITLMLICAKTYLIEPVVMLQMVYLSLC